MAAMTNHKNRIGKSRVGLGAAVALIAASTVFATPTVAQPRYDGTWSVALVTTRGDCMASFRYPIEITNGALANGGALAIDVRGRVASNGAVTVMVSHGDTHAAGSGRLSSTVGSGSWRGAGCSGSWTAERRG
jgi:hypothetical protein